MAPQDQAVIVSALLFVAAGLLPILLVLSAFWLGWPLWLATWLQY
jgi:hypothetical protein